MQWVIGAAAVGAYTNLKLKFNIILFSFYTFFIIYNLFSILTQFGQLHYYFLQFF